MAGKDRPLRVLSIDGGGMRGLYSAVYLSTLAQYYADRKGPEQVDIGKGFDLIVGTSTGAILACAMAMGKSLSRIADIYINCGVKIFPCNLPKKLSLRIISQLITRPKYLKLGSAELEKALWAEFGETTIRDIWNSRRIALAIPAVEMSHHRGWVFKTPHLKNSKYRDDKYRLVDVCMAATAAPIYRSLAQIKNPDGLGYRVFVDGGLWANNPVLVALIDALEMSNVDDHIEIYCLGTCTRQEGELIKSDGLNRGLQHWKMGGEVVSLALDAQGYVYDRMAHMLCNHVRRSCKIIRFPSTETPADFMKHLDLDATDSIAMKALVEKAQADVNETLSRCGNPSDSDGQLLNSLLSELPVQSFMKKPMNFTELS